MSIQRGDQRSAGEPRRLDSVFTARAIVLAGIPVPSSVPAVLSRAFRIAAIEPACIPSFVQENAIELPESWLIGRGPGLGFRRVFSGTTEAETERAFQAIAQEEARSRIIIDPARLARVTAALKKRGKRIVLTNGVFDLLHAGHLRLLSDARALGDALIVAINSNDSTRAIKGADRPVIPQFARARLITSLRQVEYCYIFPETDPLEALRIVRPDVLAKGSDYTVDQIVGADFVRGYGGEVARIPLVEGWSTTSMIRTIRGA